VGEPARFETPAAPIAAPRVRPGGRRGLALRIASGVLFVPALILLARQGGIAFWLLIALEVTLGLIEFYRMMKSRGLHPFQPLGVLSALALLWVSYRPATAHVGFLATAVLLLVLALELRRPEQRQRVEDIAVTSFGVLYVGWLSAHLVLLRELPWRAGLAYADGSGIVLFAFLVTWSCDTGAYLTGRLLGRTRPWTAISPRKTLEGSIGGFVCAVGASFAGAATFLRPEGGGALLTPTHALAIGVLVGLCGQVGDLVESLLKRDAASGDSSSLIPGHGGILDRFDSLYFAAPVLYHYLRAVVFQVP